MSFATLNGLVVKVTEKAGDASYVEIGDSARAVDGTLAKTVIARPRQWNVETRPLVRNDADALMHLIGGDGHVWTFDSDLVSSKGLAESASSGTVTPGTAGGKFGSYLALGAAAQVTFAAGLTGDYTLSLWRNESGTWHHYLIVYTGGATSYYKDAAGPTAGAPGTWYAVSAGSLTLGDGTNADKFDDLAALPYAASPADTWASTFYASGTGRAWSALPYLDLEGDAVNGSTVSVIGTPQKLTPKGFPSSGTWVTGQVASGVLEEDVA